MGEVAENLRRVHRAASGKPTAEDDLRWVANWLKWYQSEADIFNLGGERHSLPTDTMEELNRIVEKWADG